MTASESMRTGLLAGLRLVVVNWRDPWHPEAGGAETYAWEMARGLRRRGAAVTYLTARADGQSAADDRDGIQIVRIGSRFTVYPRVLGWLLRRRYRFDAGPCRAGCLSSASCITCTTPSSACISRR
jgi:hypothetical protein